jgi:hypothetical protein
MRDRARAPSGRRAAIDAEALDLGVDRRARHDQRRPELLLARRTLADVVEV